MKSHKSAEKFAKEVTESLEKVFGYILTPTGVHPVPSTSTLITPPPMIHPAPTAVDFLLKKVQESNDDWFVAGGALRDSIFGMPVKDVDVFVPIRDKRYSEWRAATKGGTMYLHYSMDFENIFFSSVDKTDIFHGYVPLQCSSSEEYEIDNFVSYQCLDIPGLNVIFYHDKLWATTEDDVLHKLSEFPHNISQVASYMGDMITTKAFDEGAKSKIIKVDPTVDGIDKYNIRLHDKGYTKENGWEWRNDE